MPLYRTHTATRTTHRACARTLRHTPPAPTPHHTLPYAHTTPHTLPPHHASCHFHCHASFRLVYAILHCYWEGGTTSTALPRPILCIPGGREGGTPPPLHGMAHPSAPACPSWACRWITGWEQCLDAVDTLWMIFYILYCLFTAETARMYLVLVNGRGVTLRTLHLAYLLTAPAGDNATTPPLSRAPAMLHCLPLHAPPHAPRAPLLRHPHAPSLPHFRHHTCTHTPAPHTTAHTHTAYT